MLLLKFLHNYAIALPPQHADLSAGSNRIAFADSGEYLLAEANFPDGAAHALDKADIARFDTADGRFFRNSGILRSLNRR